MGRVPAAALAGFLWAPGCIPPTPEGFDSPDPTRRMVAITEAGVSGDESSIPDLIEQLESNDPGARMLAIRSLERLTGLTHGYDHADPWWERKQAVDRWRAWAMDRGLAGGTPELPSPD
jgi:hypothetical protein